MLEILQSAAPVPYPQALAFMEKRVAAIIDGTAPECLWLLHHPPLYTAGTSAKPHELLNPNRFPIYRAGRGGAFTYHGPGQRVVYMMLDLRVRARPYQRDVRQFVRQIEQWIIATLAEFDIAAHTIANRVGIWVGTEAGEDKIAAIGLRLRRWVSFHGIAINVNPNLEHFSGIVPCGIADGGITSLQAHAPNATMEDLDHALLHHFERLFKLHHNLVHRELVINAA